MAITNVVNMANWFTHLSVYDTPSLPPSEYSGTEKSVSQSTNQTMHKAQSIDHDSLSQIHLFTWFIKIHYISSLLLFLPEVITF